MRSYRKISVLMTVITVFVICVYISGRFAGIVIYASSGHIAVDPARIFCRMCSAGLISGNGSALWSWREDITGNSIILILEDKKDRGSDPRLHVFIQQLNN